MARWIIAGMLVLAGVDESSAGDERRYSAATAAPYEDVVDDVRFAIVEHNFRITGGNEIGQGIAKRLDAPFPKSEIVHFCNLEYARKFLEVTPDFLLHMPCKVAISERAGRVVVETWLLPEDLPGLEELSREVNTILRAVVDTATE